MVALFGKAKSTISEHLKHIFEELFGFSELLPLMANHTISHITTLMSSFLLGIVFILCKVHVSVNGLLSAFTNTPSIVSER